MASTSAPDVDLRAQGGLSRHAAVVGVALVCATYVYTRGGPGEGGAGESALEEAQEVTSTWLGLLGKLVLRCCQVVLGGAVVMLGVLVAQQRKILYVPVPPGACRSTKDNPSILKSPQRWGLPFEDLMITTADGTSINAWLVYQPLAKCKDFVPFTFVYCHGNAGNIGHRLENIRDMYEKLNCNILILDYRGYGDSEDGPGPCQSGFMMDAMATYRWLIDRIRNPKEPEVTRMREDRVLLFGRSIGGAVAIHLMADLLRERERAGPNGDSLPLPAGLVLENTFTALRDMATQLFPFLAAVSFLLRPPMVFDPWDSTECLDFITQKYRDWSCCLLSGLEDQIVPPAQMRQLRNILHEQKPEVLKFFTFKHGGHNDTPMRGGSEYWTAFQKFMMLVIEHEEKRQSVGEVE